jgi:3-phosphoglycerate kinase
MFKDMGGTLCDLEQIMKTCDIVIAVTGQGEVIKPEMINRGQIIFALSQPVPEIPPGWMAADVGPATSILFREALQGAKTIVWNGPLGAFEMAPFANGTFAMMRALAESDAVTIVGGGDTDTALHKAGLFSRMSYVSTGGGAFLELLEGKRLPGIEALE